MAQRKAQLHLDIREKDGKEVPNKLARVSKHLLYTTEYQIKLTSSKTQITVIKGPWTNHDDDGNYNAEKQ